MSRPKGATEAHLALLDDLRGMTRWQRARELARAHKLPLRLARRIQYYHRRLVEEGRR